MVFLSNREQGVWIDWSVSEVDKGFLMFSIYGFFTSSASSCATVPAF